MSRTTGAILLAAAVSIMTIGAYFVIIPRVRQAGIDQAAGGLLETGELLEVMDAADNGRLVWKMSMLADRSSLKNLLKERPDKAAETSGWLNKLRAEVASLTTAAREIAPVEDFFITDETGAVLEEGEAQDLDTLWWEYSPSETPGVDKQVTISAMDLPGHVTEWNESLDHPEMV